MINFGIGAELARLRVAELLARAEADRLALAVRPRRRWIGPRLRIPLLQVIRDAASRPEIRDAAPRTHGVGLDCG